MVLSRMPAKKWPWAVTGAMAALAIALALAQRRTAAALRAEIGQLRGQQSAWQHLQTEHHTLAAAQISDTEKDKLRNDHTAIARLRNEIELLKRQAEDYDRAAKTAPAKTVPVKITPSILQQELPVNLWKNAGSATPAASLETVLWAAAGGDIDALVRHLAFDPDVKARAEALFRSLPAETQAQYGSPERLVASLAAKSVPLGSAKIVDLKTTKDGDVLLAAQLSQPPGKTTRHALFYMRQEGAEWKLAVRQGVIEKYAELLTKPVVSVEGK